MFLCKVSGCDLRGPLLQTEALFSQIIETVVTDCTVSYRATARRDIYKITSMFAISLHSRSLFFFFFFFKDFRKYRQTELSTVKLGTELKNSWVSILFNESVINHLIRYFFFQGILAQNTKFPKTS